MATLTGTTIQSTYDSLLKVTDNDSITGSLKRITDGLGNNTPLYLSSSAVEIVSALNVIGNITGTNLSGTNTGDETKASIESKLGAATSSNSGYLTSTDWSTFNNKIAGSGTLNKLAKFSSSSSIADSTITDTGSAVTIGVATTVSGTITSSGFVKTGGSPFEFLKADGTVDTNSYVTFARTLTINGTSYDLSADRSWTISTGLSGSGTTNYVPKFTGSTSLGNSLIFDNGTNVGIGTTTPATRLEVRNNASSPIGWGGVAPFDNRYGELTWDVSQAIVQANSGYALQFNTNGANERMRITSGGNVGIGTSSPVSIGGYIIQTINGTSGSFTEYQENGGNTFRIGSDVGQGGFIFTQAAFGIRFGTNSTERMRITSGGNVGIGTTSPANLLTIIGNDPSQVSIEASSGNTNSQLNLKPSGTGIAYIKNQANTDFAFGTNNTERMRISSGGNVGIGMTNPTNALHVSGNIGVGNSTNNFIRYRTASNWDYYLGATNDDFRIYDSQSTNFISLIYNGGGNGKYTSILDRLYVFNTGNVGIGTSSPNQLLSVGSLGSTADSTILIGSSTTTTGNLFFGDGTGINVYRGYLQYNHADDSLLIGTSSTERMRITSTGNVGIGTTSAANAISGTETVLKVSNSNIASLYLESTAAGAGMFAMYVNTARNLVFYDTTAATERMRITSGGNVGIGTSSPSYKLDVVGGINYQNQYNRQTASYTLVLGDASKIVEMNVAGTNNNLTVPPNSSVAFPIGTEVFVTQYGSGQTSFVAGSGVTIRSDAGKLTIANQYKGACLVKVGTDEWYLIGSLK